MRHGSPTPTLEQFKDACRREFSFLFELGYSELQNPDSAEPFKVLFSNGTLTVSIRGENYGQHAGVSFFHNDGREAPPVMSCHGQSALGARLSTLPASPSWTTSASQPSESPATVARCSLAMSRSSMR